MKFKISDYSIGTNCYSIYIYQKPLSEHDYFVIVEKIKYYCGKGGFSWLAVYSTTESKTARSAAVRTGKRGRPKKSIQGKKEDGHIHNIIVGTKEKSAHSIAHKIKDSLDKKYKRKICSVISKGNCDISKGESDHAYNVMSYCMKQADIIRTGGDFDFKENMARHDYFKDLK